MRIKAIKLSDKDERRFWSKVQKSQSNDCWIWKGHRSPKGYGTFYIRVKGKDTTVRAHRVAFALTNGDTNLIVLHRCNNPSCCNPKHLRAGTHSENTTQSVNEHRHVDTRGEKHGMSKLTPAQVKRIRKQYANGRLQREIAKDFGVTRSYVSQLCNNVRWAHLE